MKKLSKVLTMIALIIGLVSMIFIFMMWGKGDDVIKTDVAAQGMTIEPLFTITYALFVISVATIIFFVIRMWVKNPKEFMGSLVYIGGFVLVVLIGYLLMDNSPVMLSKGDFSSAADAGLADFGLWVTYILSGITILAVVFGGFLKAIK